MDPRKEIEKAQRRYASASTVVPVAERGPAEHLMLLPAATPSAMRLVRIPDDFEAHEAFRRVTGLIAAVEEDNPDYDWEEIQAMLEDQGFETVEFTLGPSLD